MPQLPSSFVYLSIAVIGLVTAAVLYRVAGLDLSLSLLSGTIFVLLASLVETRLRSWADRARLTEAIDHLALMQGHLRSETDRTRQQVGLLVQEMETKLSTRNERIVSEVKVLETLIRRLADGIAKSGKAQEGVARPEPRAASRQHNSDAEMLEVVRQSLEENRVDLYLQPIVSLPQRRIRFYEAYSRLRSKDGELIMPADYIKVAEPAGLMSVVDNVLLFRCIQVVRRLTARNKDMAVFCNISRYTLQDSGFFSQFLEFMQHHRDLAGLIIFELSQEALDACGPVEEANLGYLASLGFSFSMDRVTTLDLDFARLRESKIRYVKISAQTLLGDVARAGSVVAAPDLKELMGRFGLSLIAEKIEAERDVVNLLDFNIDFAQGFLFGAPKPLREIDFSGTAPPRKVASTPDWPKPAADPNPRIVDPPRLTAEAVWPRKQIRPTSIANLAASHAKTG